VPPEPGSFDYPAQAKLRAVFAGMTAEQRDAVNTLVRDTAFGALYWSLVKLDSCPSATVDLVAASYRPDGSKLPPTAVNEMELKHLWFEWTEKFSETLRED
jgi:hypothetical protein